MSAWEESRLSNDQLLEVSAALAREAKLREALARAGAPLEVLRAQIAVKPYREMTAEFQQEIVDATEVVRAALASPAEPATDELDECPKCGAKTIAGCEPCETMAASSVSAGAGQDCHICKRPRNGPGELWCSYPHSLAGQVPADTIEKAREALRGAEVVLKHLADCAEEGVGWAYSLKTVRMAEDDAREALAALAAVRAPEEQAER